MADAQFWDARYAGADYAYGERPNAFLESLASLFKTGERALVPGDGEGRNGVFLAERGLRVETLDLSPLGVAKAQALAARRGVALDARVADVLAWDWPVAAYDGIVLLYLHFAEAERRVLHARAVAALKPGGRLVLEAFTPAQLQRQSEGARGGPREAALLYAPDDLRADFAALDIERLEEAEEDMDSGALHVGRGAVVRLIARKKR
jgi:SAM-dependent methyltransferase